MTKMEKILLGSDDVRWDVLLAKFQYDFYHYRAYQEMEAHRLQGKAYAIYSSFEGGELFLPFILRSIPNELNPGSETLFDVTTSYGYACPLFNIRNSYDEVSTYKILIGEFIKSVKCLNVISIFLRLDPLTNMPLKALEAYGNVLLHGETVWLDLNATDEELWRQTRSTTRNEIKKLIQNNYIARLSQDKGDLSIFNRLYEENMKRINAESWYLFGEKYIQKLAAALGNALYICVVEKDGIPCCAALFPVTNGRMQYYLSGTSDAFFGQPVTKLMLHYVRTFSKAQGYTLMHLGGGLGAKNDSLFAFKSGFSKLRAPFYTWQAVVCQERYNLMCEKWSEKYQQSIDICGNFFPPYRFIPPECDQKPEQEITDLDEDKESKEKIFKKWKWPLIENNKLNEYSWLIQNKEGFSLGFYTDIGAFTYINAINGVIIEDYVQVGSHCSIYSRSTIDNKQGTVVLKKNCKIGTHSVIMPGVTIGENAIVGAFSFVNSDVPAGTIAYGVPAKVIKKVSLKDTHS